MRQSHSLGSRTRLGICLALAALAVFCLRALPADSASTSKLTTVGIREDSFRNFDFLSESNRAGNVDWAISLLFWNNAEIDKVKDELKSHYYWEGSPIYALLNNGNGWVWDRDSGKKEVKCILVGDSVHYRVYAPVNDRLYNMAWGFYIIGSDHIDHNECNLIDHWSGASEKAERQITRTAKAVYGVRRVQYHWTSFFNFMPHFNQGDHHWENDGAATRIKVP